MAQSTDRTSDLASLFVAITGRSTVTERQQFTTSSRLDDVAASELRAYVGETTRANGLDDAIAEPDAN